MRRLRRRNDHPSDEELLLVADRECSPRRAARVREHLARCAACEARMSALESTLAGFLSWREQEASSLPPASAASRASLKAGLAQAGGRSNVLNGKLWPHGSSWPRQLAGAWIALLIVAGSVWFLRMIVPRHLNGSSAEEIASALPRRRLTPGVTRQVRLEELCRDGDRNDDPPVNVSMEQQVLTEYGVPIAARTSYQLDYLITPALGGTDDIRNLWPEPYSSTTWNAHVKDALEDHLHGEVCQGRLSLSIAQEEIAADWIAAYKREFHTETPITDNASLGSAGIHATLPFPPEPLARHASRL